MEKYIRLGMTEGMGGPVARNHEQKQEGESHITYLLWGTHHIYIIYNIYSILMLLV